MNINPIIILISQVISLYTFALVVYIIIHWLIHFDMLNRKNKTINKIHFTLSKIIEPFLDKIRKFIPLVGGIDLSPIVAFLLLGFVRNILFTYFYVR